MAKIIVGGKVIVKLYSCGHCGVTMMIESFTDEQTTFAMMKQNPYCDECAQLKSAVWTPKDMTNASPCTAKTYKCKDGLCMLHADCRNHDRHECPECYDLLST